MHPHAIIDDVGAFGDPPVPSIFRSPGPHSENKTNTSQHTIEDGYPRACEPIAVVGMGCRLPGEISSDSALWNFLREERSGQCDVPSSRFNIDTFYHPKGGRLGSLPMTGGYFLSEDVRLFENSFFGINNLEATYMDPLQRKLLEVCFECFESAGMRMEDIAGACVGCYVGSFTIDFQTMQAKDPETAHRYSATGAGTTILSNRVSHAFDLRGPSVTLDTACSSSLYALHFACRALGQRECDAAIVAGANLIQSPEQQITTAMAGVLSSTSTCHTFSANADGYGRADGIGALYLKRLSDAIRDNDPIRSIVRGTAINSNGRTPGITLPSSVGQEAVIAKAYDAAGLDCDATDYVECHGTGTQVGDPIEVEALARFYDRASKGQSKTHPLLIGSVKSNLGHSEATSGITSVIKTTLALEHREIPATIGIEKLNPKIPWDKYNIQVVRSLVPWPQTSINGHIPRASINSFGYGGSNAHCILERAESFRTPCDSLSSSQSLDERAYLLPFSAASSKSLERRVQDLERLNVTQIDVSDLAFTLSERRSHLGWRGYLVARQKTISNDIDVRILQSTAPDARDNDIPYAFVFTGQGAQWPQMGKELFEHNSIFRNSILCLETYLSKLPVPPLWSLSGITECILAPSDCSDIHLPSISQPVCTAVQMALVDLLRYWGIVPDYVIGHSSGEIAAAYSAGHVSSFYAIAIAYLRGQIVASSSPDGAMIAVGVGSEEAERLIQSQNASQNISVACINSPESVTLSGDANAIEMLFCFIESQGKFVRKLKTGARAYHSHHMKLLGKDYEAMLSSILQVDADLDKSYVCIDSLQIKKSTTMISTVWARTITPEETSNPIYWRANLESPVLFSPAVELLMSLKRCQLIEVGPHAALELPVKQIQLHLANAKSDAPYLSVLYRNKDSERSALSLIGKLWSLGRPVDFHKVKETSLLFPETKQRRGGKPRVLHNLPTYKWDYPEPLWTEPRASTEFRHRRFPRDELLGSLIPGTSGFTSTWRNLLSVFDVPWLQDHKLAEDVVFPAAGYVVMATKAAQQLASVDTKSMVLEIQHVKIIKALLLSSQEPVEIFTEVTPRRISDSNFSSSWWQFTIMTFAEGRSIKHASGSVGFKPKSIAFNCALHNSAQDTEPQAIRNWYAEFSKVGLNFGASFESLSEVSNPRMRDAMTTVAKMAQLPTMRDEYESFYSHNIHPITVDAQLQAGMIASTSGSLERLQSMIPVEIECLQIHPSFQSTHIPSYTILAACKPVGYGVFNMNCELHGLDGDLLLKLSDVKSAPFHGSMVDNLARHPMLRVVWQPDISSIRSENEVALAAVINQYLTQTQSEESSSYKNVTEVLGLISHGQCDIKILELGGHTKTVTKSMMAALDCDTKFQKCKSYTLGRVNDEGRLMYQQVDKARLLEEHENPFENATDQQFDVIIFPWPENSTVLLAELHLVTECLRPGGKLLFNGDVETKGLLDLGFHFLRLGSLESRIPVMLAWQVPNIQELRAPLLVQSSEVPNFFMVVKTFNHPLNDLLKTKVEGLYGCNLTVIKFDDLGVTDITPKSTVIVTVEIEDSLLINLTPKQLCCVQSITDNASKLLWVTGGSLITSQRPEFAAVFGLSRAIVAEQPSLRFFVVDLDNTTERLELTASNLVSILDSASIDGIDREYLQKDGVLHISRMVPDEAANSTFQRKKAAETTRTTLSDAQRCELSIREPGQLDTLEFIQLASRTHIPQGHVEVMVKAAGLNAKDVYTLTGKIETQENTCSCEFAGVVSRVGGAVSSLNVGDKVVVAAPGRFSTYECVPEWACCKMQDHENFTDMSTAPVVFMTAIHALRNLANLQAGESVLIHSAAGGVGIAAIQLAKEIKAEIFATVGTDEKKTFLVNHFGLKPQHIFNSRDLSFLPGVMEATNNRGVDVVLNSLTGEQLHSSLEACASFGRFVEIGKRDILDAGNLNLRAFSRGLTFSAFDLHELYYSEITDYRGKSSRLLLDGVELFRRRPAPPPVVFAVPEISAACRFFANSFRIGKIAISYENAESMIQAVPRRFATVFDPKKSYFLIGCLGGLGRSLARHMLSNGARHFTFLSRSGTDKSAADFLVQDLKRGGAIIDVVRGDVQDYTAVQTAVNRLHLPLGGVVQAAMGLSESLFTSMTHKQWHTSLGPKTIGTWNIHNAISGKDAHLDFFLMTSSMSGSIGSATESNYCAANSFLDHFAGYRRSCGLPATSVGLGQISEVGYLHEHPEIEQMLARRGIAAITEDDLLQIIDIALSGPQTSRSSIAGAADAHLLSGLEPSGMQAIWNQGYEGSHEGLKGDLRLKLLTSASTKDQHTESSKTAKGCLSPAIAAALTQRDRQSLWEAVFDVLAAKLSHLVLMPIEKISQQMRLNQIGMDSMLAAEYRTLVFRTFTVDVPFLLLMNSETRMLEITNIVCDGLMSPNAVDA